MKNKKLVPPLLLALTAVIWGTAFVAQSVSLDYIEPFTFSAVRCILGGLVLIPCIMLFDKLKGKKISLGIDKTVLVAGIICGTVMFVASNFQQFGLKYTTAGKAGFITAFYIVIVPILGLFLKRRCSPLVWAAVAVALVGLYLLCVTEQFTVGIGDILVFMCAVVFSVHIMVVDRVASKVDGVRLSCIQFLVCGVLSLVAMFIFEKPAVSAIWDARVPILYGGIMSCGVAYTLQILGQRGTEPTVASLLMSLESVFAVLAGWVILHETLSTREFIGCVLVFAAILLVEVGPALLEKRKKVQKEA